MNKEGQCLADHLRDEARAMQEIGMRPEDIATNFPDLREEAKESGFSRLHPRARREVVSSCAVCEVESGEKAAQGELGKKNVVSS